MVYTSVLVLYGRTLSSLEDADARPSKARQQQGTPERL